MSTHQPYEPTPPEYQQYVPPVTDLYTAYHRSRRSLPAQVRDRLFLPSVVAFFVVEIDGSPANAGLTELLEQCRARIAGGAITLETGIMEGGALVARVFLLDENDAALIYRGLCEGDPAAQFPLMWDEVRVTVVCNDGETCQFAFAPPAIGDPELN